MTTATDSTTETIDPTTLTDAEREGLALTQQINTLEAERLRLYQARRALFVKAFNEGSGDQRLGDINGLRRQNIHDQRTRWAKEQADAAKAAKTTKPKARATKG